MQDLNVTLVQANLLWENTSGNLSHFEKLFEKITTTDLIILPEMFKIGRAHV